MIEITAKILKFHPNDMIEDYDDGTFESFDCSELEVLEPSTVAGQKIYIYFSYM